MVRSLVSIFFDSPQLGTDILNFNFLENDKGSVSPPHFLMIVQEKCFTCYIQLTNRISLPNCLCFLRHWKIFALQLFVSRL